ncbi:BTAD domain-containing putative transcriptional regulator [Kitasatospora sp. NPDC101155]|uniref:AfsR/SARP family transcriptional regulator n=1 Tax=Kitasatospora sp. NPDC101155 TaxID=3364097 RepID=UPI00380D9C30
MLVALLLLRPNAVVTTDELIADLWGDEPPGSPVVALRSYMSQLRKLLEPVREKPTVLLSQAGGYRLTIEPDHIDLWRVRQFHKLSARCSAEHPERARDHLREALSLWRGEPLVGLPGPLMHRERQRLSELRLTLLEERLTLDDPADHLPELKALTDEHPFRERLQALLVRALHRNGRTPEARATYDALHSRLVEHLGIEPGPELTALSQELDGSSGAPDQLPSSPSHFTGRQDHVTRITRALTNRAASGLRLVTVAGMAGVGKTTLAVRAAHTLRPDFPDGRLYADLRGADLVPASASDILADFLTALGIQASAIPKDLAGRSTLFRTASTGKRLLILLDNARDDAQIQPLLPGSSDCAVIVTSRTVLNSVPSVLHLALDVFTEQEAISLLDSVIGTTRLDPQRPQAELLVEACGLLPLAVRIAAARLAATPDQPIADLVRRLADDHEGIAALRTSDLAVAQVFDLSYRLLPPPLATAFRMLSWVEPDIGLASAAAVLGLTGDQAERLAEALVDQALLESIGAGRYRYHDLVRAFARRTSLQLGDNERTTAHQHLLTLLLTHARTAFALAVPGDPVADVFGERHPQPTSRPTFADAALSRIRTGHAAGAVHTCQQILAEPGGTADAAMTAYVHYVLGLAYQVLGRLGDAAEQMRSCIGCAGPAGDLDRESAARSRLADILRLIGRVDEAVQEAERALDLATKGGRQRERALAHLVLANTLTARGDHALARTHEAEAHLLLSRLSAPESADAKSLLTALATGDGSVTVD